ncbi:hypothetical protein LVY75_32280 [Sinorhizobium sp. B11]
MNSWKKSLRNIPAAIESELRKIQSRNVQVLAGKKIASDDIRSGDYAHLGLTLDRLNVGNRWELVPGADVGKTSARNVDGWEIVRKDLPKYKKYFYQDIPIYGNGARNGWTTAAIPRDVYHRDQIPPYLLQLNVFIQEQLEESKYGIVFSIDQVFDRQAPSFRDDLLFALNLLQENTGVVGISSAENPEFVFTTALDWSVFPPGDIDRLAAAWLGEKTNGVQHDTVLERLSLFEQFKPSEYLRGMGGNDHYIGAKFADDLVAFENLRYGNALYVLYANWEELSRRPRNELLKLPHSQFDRIIHITGWEQKFAALMQQELQDRGIRVRIGRHLRHRRRRGN